MLPMPMFWPGWLTLTVDTVPWVQQVLVLQDSPSEEALDTACRSLEDELVELKTNGACELAVPLDNFITSEFGGEAKHPEDILSPADAY